RRRSSSGSVATRAIVAAEEAMCLPPRQALASSISCARSVTTTKFHGCPFPADGARRPASQIRSSSSRAIGWPVYWRTLRRARIASHASMAQSYRTGRSAPAVWPECTARHIPVRYGEGMDAGQLPEVASASEAREVGASGADSAPWPGRADQARLFFSSLVMLFVELALIRWITANNVYVTEATNFVLLASFLGIGIGFLNAASSRDYLRWTPLALLALVTFVLEFPVVLHSSVGGPLIFSGAGQARALPQPVSFGLVFLLTVAVMAGI